jgi:YaiO family outer membrane protein
MLSDAPPAYVCVVQHAAPTDLNAARAARLADDYAQAQCVLAQILEVEPHNPDALVELGFLSLAAGDTAAAHDAFQRAIEFAPDYDDAKYGLAQTAYRAGNPVEARAWLARISDARRQDPDVVALHRAVSRSEARSASWRWDAWVAHSDLSDGLAPWRETSVAVTRRSARLSLGLALEHAERFGLEGSFAELRVSRQHRNGVWGFAIGGAGNADFRPEAAVRIEYASPEDRRTTFLSALTVARYAVGQVETLSVRARRAITPSLNMDARGIVVQDEADDVRTGFGAGTSWRAHDRIWLDLAYVDAPESSEGVTVDVRSTTLGFSAELSPDLRVRLGVTKEARDAFDRTEIAVNFVRVF